MFFFSSRRRHTRWTGDWSSDVCSSDLIAEADKLTPNFPWSKFFESQGLEQPKMFSLAIPKFHEEVSKMRSEERRVGKSVDLGGGGSIKKKQDKTEYQGQ